MSEESVEIVKRFHDALNDLDADEFIDLGDRVVSCGHMRGRGARSGASIETPRSWLWAVRDGRIVRHRTFTERSEALDAAAAQD
jgi:ketosteroid isomerase-like protein